MIGIRRATFGDEYDFRAKCPHCEEKDIYGTNLSKLKVLHGDRELVEKRLKDPKATFDFEFEDGTKIKWRFSDGSDYKKALMIMKKKSTTRASANLELRIVEVIDPPDGMPLKTWIKEIDWYDIEAFNEFYKEKEPGIDDMVELTCSNGLCGEDFEIKLPMSPELFFKRSSRKKTS